MKYNFRNRESDLYKLRRNAQTVKWVHGTAEHNTVDNECTPDFSCCNPTLAAPLEDRAKFYEALKENKQHITTINL